MSTPPATKPAVRTLPVARFLMLLINVLCVLLGLRVVLILFGANIDQPLVAFILSFTDPIAAPFEGIVFPLADQSGPVSVDSGAVLGIAALQLGALLLRVVRASHERDRMTERRIQVGLAVVFFALLLIAAPLWFDLFTSLVAATAVLLALYAVVRPSLLLRALSWSRIHPRQGLVLVLGGMALLVAAGFTGDQIRHPSVTAAEEGADWAAANGALAQVAAADLHWQAATAADRLARVSDVRTATHLFADSVNLLERIRPPEEGLHAHRAAAAVYREMAEVLDVLPSVLANGEIDRAADIWKTVGGLSAEASTFLELSTSP